MTSTDIDSLEAVRLAVIGLGYVGLPLAVEFGKKRDVVGFDINTARIAALAVGQDSTLARKSWLRRITCGFLQTLPILRPATPILSPFPPRSTPTSVRI